jgi:hypothetical protein
VKENKRRNTMRKFLLLTALSSSLTLLNAAGSLPTDGSTPAASKVEALVDVVVSINIGQKTVDATFKGVPLNVAHDAGAFANGRLMQIRAIVDNTLEFETTATTIAQALGRSGEVAGEIYALLIPAFTEQVTEIRGLMEALTAAGQPGEATALERAKDNLRTSQGKLNDLINIAKTISNKQMINLLIAQKVPKVIAEELAHRRRTGALDHERVRVLSTALLTQNDAAIIEGMLRAREQRNAPSLSEESKADIEVARERFFKLADDRAKSGNPYVPTPLDIILWLICNVS